MTELRYALKTCLAAGRLQVGLWCSLGSATATEVVQSAIRPVLELRRSGGAVTGVLAPINNDARRYVGWGARFVAVGSDLGLLTRHGDALAATFRATDPTWPAGV